MLLTRWLNAVAGRIFGKQIETRSTVRRGAMRGTSLATRSASWIVGSNGSGHSPEFAEVVEQLEDRSLLATASLAFTSAVSSDAEGSTLLVSVTLTTDGALLGAFTADVSITDTNSEVADRTLNTAMVTFGAGSVNGATFNVSLSLADDTLVEGDETLTLTLSNPVSAGGADTVSLGGQTTNGVTITDTDSATVAYELASSSRNEDESNLAVTLVLTTNGGSTLENNAVFSVPATLGTAELADFNSGSFPMTITFFAGSGNGAMEVMSIDPSSDTFIEGDETFTLGLSVTSGAAMVGAQDTHVVTLTDADTATATVAFQSATTTAGEDGAATDVTLVLTTTAGNTLENNASFTISATNGSAESADYDSGSFPKTVTFLAGQGNGGTQTVSFDPDSDLLVEGNETVTLAVVDGTLLTGSGQTSNVVTIDDADMATVVVNASQSVTEDGGAQAITVQLVTTGGNTLENALTVSLSAAAAAGTEAADATFGALGSFMFAASAGNGTTNSTLLFAPMMDTLVEGNELATLTPSGSLLNGQVSYTANDVTITDADTATVAYDLASSSVGEDAGNLTVTLLLTTAGGNTLENNAVFSVPATLGTAEAADFNSGSFPMTVTFLAASGNGAMQVFALDPSSDTLIEGDETLTLGLSVMSGAATLGAQATHTVTILDADAATVAFQSATSTVGEDDAATDITVVLTTAAGNTLENNASFSVSAANGTAENADYDQGSYPKTVTFTAGQGNGGTQTVSFDPASDTVVEGSETVTLTLAVTSGVATLGAQTTNLVTITDADAATVAFSLATTAVGEADGATNVTAVLMMLNAGDTLENDAVFSVTPTNGSAEDADYDFGAFPKTITFVATSGDGATQNTSIDPADDTLVEGSETVTLTLAVTSGAATLGAQTMNLVTIADADAATVAFSLATTAVGEDDAAATDITLVLTTAAGNTLENNASVTISATNGSAENADYDSGLFPKTVTFLAGQGNGGTQTVSFDSASDTLVEGNETVTLAVVDGTLLTGSGQTSNAVTIADADTATVVVNASQSVTEDGGAQAITVQLVTTGDNTLENALTVSLSAAAAAGTEAADATFGALGSFMFAAAAGNGATNSALMFTPNSDTLVEGNEMATLTPSGSTLNGQVSYTANNVTITDADTATVEYVLASSSVGEDAGNLAVSLTLTTAAGNTLENNAVFSVPVTLGMAEATDFNSGSFPMTVTFFATSGNGTMRVFALDPSSDTLVEGDETLTLGLLVTSGAATLGEQVTHAVTILEADEATVAFQSATATVGEDDAVATDITLVLTTAAGHTLENNATVTISATNGTAESADYDAGMFPKTVTFLAGQGNGGTQTVSFDPTSDTLVEGEETVTLDVVDGTLLTGSGQTSNEVTIDDADTATVVVDASQTVTENGGAQGITVRLVTTDGNTLENALTVSLSAAAAAGTEAGDATFGALGSFMFAAGAGNDATSSAVTFAPNPDTLVEGDELATLTPSGSSVDGQVTYTANDVTISDGDTATVSFSSATSTQGEDAGVTTLAATLTTTDGSTLENAATFSITNTLGTAEAIDFGQNVVSLTFAMGSGNGASPTTDLMVTPAPDMLVEGNETVTFTLAVTSGEATVGETPANTLTITDADTATVSFTSATSTQGEDAGVTTLAATLTTAAGNTLENAATFSITNTLGSAEAIDFSQNVTSLTFAAGTGNAGSPTTDLMVTPAPDMLVEGDETVTFTLAVTGGAATVGATPANLLTITDADTATVSFTSAASTLGEDAGVTTLAVTLTTAAGNTLENAATFSVTSMAVSTEMADGSLNVTSLTFAMGSGNGASPTTDLMVTPAPDTLVEGDESATFTLAVTGGAATLGANPVHTLTIDDADTATVVVDADQTVTEDGGAQGITVRLVTTDGNTLENALTVMLSAAAAIGTEAGDATFGALGSFMFAAGAGNDATDSTLTFSPNADTLVEGNELATLTPSGSLLDGQVTYTANDVTILDADSATVSFSSATSTRGEDAGATTLAATLSTAAGNTLENAATFSITFTLGTAEALDFSQNVASLTFTAGSDNGHSPTTNLMVTPAPDLLVEGDETVTFTLAVTGGAATVGATPANLLTITDADTATVVVDAGQSVTEDGGAQGITVRLVTAGGNTLENALTVSLSAAAAAGTEAGDATFGALGSFMFAAGAANDTTDSTLTFSPTSDTVVEVDELATLTAAGSTLNGQVSYTANDVTITDNDTLLVEFSQAAGSDNEASGGNLPRLLVTGSVEAGNSVTINVAVSGASTATGGGVDFVNPTVLMVTGGTYAAASFAIPSLAVVFDMMPEGPETIVLNGITGSAVTVGDANGVGGTQSSTTYTIADQAALSINDVSIAEGNSGTSTLTFTVTLSGATGSPFSVAFQTANGTATTADLDYVPRNSSTGLVIGAFDGARGGAFSLSDGANAAAMRAAILANFPGATIVDTSTLTASFLAGVDVVWLNSVANNLDATAPLSAAEQLALQNFVSAGGGAILFGEHSTFDDTSLLSPFGLATASSVDNLTSGTITNLAHPVTAGPFGNVTTISSNFAGNLTTLGGATSLGTWNSSGLSALAVLSSGTGKVVAFTDANMYTDRFGAADNQKVLLNSLAFAKPASGLQFAGTAGETHTISVLINGDVNSELNETFSVVLGSVVGTTDASILDGTGIGTIQNDDAAPVVPIVNDQSFGINENSANATVVGTVVATDPGDVLTYSITGGNGLGGFAINSATGQLTVANSAVLDFETTPTFLLTVQVQDAGGLTDTATITVNLNNLQATLSINDVTQAEGDSGTSQFVFSVTLSAATGAAFTVPFNTADGTAMTSNNDYVALSSSSTLKVGAFNGTRGGDFSLSNGSSAAAMNAAILANFPGATIVGTSTLNAEFLSTVNVVWLNSVSTNTTATSALTLAEQTALTNFVNAGGGAIIFGEHNFFNDSSLLSPFSLATDSSNDGVNVGTITNLVHPVTAGPFGSVATISSNFSGNLTSLGAATSLGNWNSSGLSAVAVLNSGSGKVVALTDVNLYADQLGSADNQKLLLNALAFAKPVGSLQFVGTAGEVRTISVTVNGDITLEGSEDFNVLLTGISGSNDVTILDGTGVGTISDDDIPAILQVSDSLVSERSKQSATFNVTLSSPSTQAVTVKYSTTRTVSSGIAAIGTGPTATVGKDFKATTGTLRFAPGQMSQTVSVPVIDDVLHEGDETFFLQLSAAAGATISDGLGQATIRDNDAAPKLNISDATVTEKDAATVEAKFTVKLSAVSAVPVTVEYSTANGTATAGADYQAANGTITFNPGETSKTILVVTSADLLHEASETYFVNLSNSVQAAIVDGQGKGTIKDNDKAPRLSIADVSVIEGRTAEFTVSLSAPSGQAVTVNFATANGTALAGQDFSATSGTLTFAAGETSKTIRVAIAPNAIATATKSFKVNLSKAVNGVFADSQALATILDSN
ncbi:MAG: Calx-beta domain-containing protein [Planctomycetaceae bacterium]